MSDILWYGLAAIALVIVMAGVLGRLVDRTTCRPSSRAEPSPRVPDTHVLADAPPTGRRGVSAPVRSGCQQLPRRRCDVLGLGQDRPLQLGA